MSATPVARALMRIAVHLVPHTQRAWAAAMAAEFDHLPDGHMAFAAGCLRSCLMLHVPPARNLLAFALLASATALFALQLSGLARTATFIDRPLWWCLSSGIWVLPVGFLVWAGWKRNMRPAWVCLLLVGIGLASTLAVISMPDGEWARITGSRPLELVLVASLVMVAGWVRRQPIRN